MSDDDWESQATAAPVAAAAVDPWADEDAEEEAPDEWDADPEQPKAAPVANSSKPKAISKRKREEKMRKLELEAQRRLATMSMDERHAEKARRQQIIEDADHKLTEELFCDGAATGDAPAAKAAISDYKLSGLQDYETMAKEVGARITESMNPVYIVSFLKEVMRSSCEPLTSDDLNGIKQAVNALFNDKRKSEGSKKKKGSKKSKSKSHVNVGASRGVAGMDDMGFADYDDADDYDFI